MDVNTQNYLASVMIVLVEGGKQSVVHIDVIRECSDIFSYDLLDLSPHREVEFIIELLLRTLPISKATYKMTPTELVKLKKRLQELLDKRLICPSVSPMGYTRIVCQERR